jgi:hypothetical protein
VCGDSHKHFCCVTAREIFSEYFPMTFPICTYKYFLPYPLIAYLLTPWSRVLLEKLTGFQLVRKFPAFYGTVRFITAFFLPYYNVKLQYIKNHVVQNPLSSPFVWIRKSHSVNHCNYFFWGKKIDIVGSGV